MKKPDFDQQMSSIPDAGEMETLTSTFDWASTSLGSISAWPHSLKTIVKTMLGSRYAMWVGWGPEFTFFYNDAYASMTLGAKHPSALGRPAKEVWSEIWADVGPRAEQVICTGQATWDEGLLLFLERQGFPEETYHTFSYSPVPDDGDGIGGLLCVVTEDTERTIGERRLDTLRELAARTMDEAKSAVDSCKTAARILAQNPHDVPFALLYLLDGSEAKLAGLVGVEAGLPFSPLTIDLNDPGAPWPFREVIETGNSIDIHDLGARFDTLIAGVWPEPPQHAMVLPLAKPGHSQRAGFLVAGISPRRPFDEVYRGFLTLLAGQIASAIANASAFEEERQRVEALAQLDLAKTAFFSNVSHEFRTPLTLMLGPVEDLLASDSTQLPAPAREQIELVNRNGLRLLRLVNTLLDFSRIEAGRVKASFQPSDLATYTAELVSVFRSACERAGLHLNVDCAPLAEPVYVDREMWEKVVLNLLSNAFKFTLVGEIAVTLRQVGDTAELRVKDSGTGIPPEEMPRLFERFHRVENAKGRTHEGSGIGLAMVHELIKLHGGAVRAESSVGHGTTFIVSMQLGSAHLPAAQIAEQHTPVALGARANPFVEEALRWLPEDKGQRDQAQTPAFSAEPPSEAGAAVPGDGTPKRRILIADDNADMRQYLGRLLGGVYKVDAVGDGKAALEAVRANAPELIITDVMMPRIDGFGLLQALRTDAATRELPVIMLSARAGEESRIEGMKAGADDYLVKPFSARELLARVGAHLQMADLRRQSQLEQQRLLSIIEQERDHLRVTLASIGDGVITTDVHGCVTNLNGVSETLTGWTNAEAAGKPLEQVFHIENEDTRLPVQNPALVALANGRIVGLANHTILIARDGVEWPIDDSAAPIRNDKGEVIGCVLVFREITDRKRAENLLRESEAHFRSMADNAPTMLWTTDATGACTYLSKRWYEFTGRTPEQDLGLGWLDNIHPDDFEESKRIFLDATEREAPFSIDYRVRQQDGQYRWAVDAGLPRFGADGQFQGFVGTVTDIHERKQAESLARETEGRLLTLVEQVRDYAIFVTDLEGRATSWNEGVCQVLGFAEAEFIGKDIVTTIFTPEDIANGTAEKELEIAASAGQANNDRWMRRKDGQRFFAMGITTALHDTDNRLIGFMKVMRDQTQQKLLEDELRRTAADLSEANRRKTEFLATLSHELRNPLAPIRTGLELMKMTAHVPEQVEATRLMMETQVKQLVRLIDDLLDISRISQGKLQLRTCNVALAEVVQSAVEASRPAIAEAGHEFNIALPSEPVFVDADPHRLAQVFSNLLNNSIKYTPDGGHIWLSVDVTADRVRVTVKDTGIGIPRTQQAGIFEMFTQIDRPLEKGYKGLGIGLTLVKQLVQMHGGSVEVRSEGDNAGSEFIVQLPILAAGAVLHTEEEPAGPQLRLRVLVVDDNQAAADSLSMMIQMLGNDTHTAYDGQQAVQAAATFRPDVVLMDIGMPVMNGYEAARHIRKQEWGTRMVLVALTGWGQEEDRRRTEESGFDHHIVKPAEPGALQRLFAGVKT